MKLSALSRYERLRLRSSIGQAISSLESTTTWKDYGEEKLFPGLIQQSYPWFSKRFPKTAKILDSSSLAKGMDVAGLLSATIGIVGIKSDRTQAVTGVINAIVQTYSRMHNGYGRDGSDEMQELIAWYDVLSRISYSTKEESHELFLRAVNLQLVVSYTASGLIKAVSGPWRGGDAFKGVMRTKSYGHPVVAKALDKYNFINPLICWQTILWESLYPLAYLLPNRGFKTVILFTELFHLAIGHSMGLPRFFWAFGAAHEAALHVKDKNDK